VPAALREPTAAQAADVLKALPERTYNPFHCYVADDERAFLLSYRDGPSVRELEPGVHVVGNVDPAEEPAPKVERVRAAATAVAVLPATEILEALAGVCQEHHPRSGQGSAESKGGIEGTCVHLDAYGTRSSALLMRADDRRDDKLLFAASAPCESAYGDFSNLFLELSSESRAGRQTAPESLAVRNVS
jgi:hypothetical protein